MTTRAMFEKWAEAQGFNTERHETGEYKTLTTDAAWGGWLACSDDAEDRHSRACAEWSSICRSGRRHGASVGANECANLIRGWRMNNEPAPKRPHFDPRRPIETHDRSDDHGPDWTDRDGEYLK